MSEQLTLAQDPACSEADLIRLSKSKDPSMLAALTENPSTPISILARLGGAFPDALFRNPVLPLLLLEDPLFLRQALPQDKHIHRFLFHPLLPEVFFEDLCRLYLTTIRCVYSLPEEAWKLLHDKRFPAALLRDHLEHNVDHQGVMRHRILKSSERAPEELAMLRGSDAPNSVRLALAMAKNTPTEMLAELLCDRDDAVRWHALRHSNAPYDVVSLLHRAGATRDLNGFDKPQRLTKKERERLRVMGPFSKALWIRLPETPREYAMMGEMEGQRYDSWWLKALLSRDDLPAAELQKIYRYLHPPRYRRENVPIPNTERFPKRHFAACKEEARALRREHKLR
jgi:hypothetical protein